MLCKNVSTANEKFEIDTKPGLPPVQYDVEPGGVVDIPDGYCKPYDGPGNRKLPPIIKMIAPNMKPLNQRAKGIVATQSPTPGGQGIDQGTLTRLLDRLDKVEAENKNLRAAAQRRSSASGVGGGASSSPVPVVEAPEDEDDEPDAVEVEAETDDHDDEAGEITAEARPSRKPRGGAKAKATEG